MGEQRWSPASLLTVRETAGLLHCSEATVRRALAEGRLPYFRLRENGGIRIPAVTIDRLVTPALIDAAETATRATSDVEPVDAA